MKPKTAKRSGPLLPPLNILFEDTVDAFFGVKPSPKAKKKVKK